MNKTSAVEVSIQAVSPESSVSACVRLGTMKSASKESSAADLGRNMSNSPVVVLLRPD